ncbi:MAG: cupin domain-containing protein [Lachnospiraceae bacterium]|nr:cupin domain-containing protein [Lachnospiraceae bacterium]
MNIILLSGGSGQRLWPISNEVQSKQFMKIFRKAGAENKDNAAVDKDDAYESMLQRVYRQIKTIDADAKVTIATARTQVSAIHNQLGFDVGISVEPCRRDTFPAIALACAYLHDVQGVREDETVVVVPVDPYVEDDYFEALKELDVIASRREANLTLMGMEPTYPSEKYGYIMPETKDRVSAVKEFKEKPDEATARRYIEAGALWNGGIFAFELKYLLEKAHALIDFEDYQDLFHKYDTVTKISFDYAVAEKEEKINVLRFAGTWKDIGTWNTLVETMDEPVFGKAMLNETCEGVNVVNLLDVPVLCMGLKDVVVSASPEGVLVSDKGQSSYIKPFVDEIDQQIMFAEKSWGSFRVLDVAEDALTIKVTLNAGNRMNYHSHELRDEVWTVVDGEGRTVVDGMVQHVKAGDVVTMEAGCKHAVIADTKLTMIEVQLGKDISVRDKVKYEWPM